MSRRIRVLIVDDSAMVRKILSDSLAAQPDIEVVGTAPDPYVARDKILELAPDVLTLDIEMPRMDGLTFLKKLMRFHPLPVVIISSLGQASSRLAMEALASGAVEVLAKPGGAYSAEELTQTLAGRIRAAAAIRALRALPGPSLAAPVPGGPKPAQAGGRKVLAIGASTGGTEAIAQVLGQMPANGPCVLVVQHIPAGFSSAFAERLDRTCRMEVREAVDGDAICAGRALVAPGNFHMRVRSAPSGFFVSVEPGPPVCYQRPSVDVMFESVAESVGKSAIGVILTGMGSDGAEGLLKMKQAGACTIAQDEESCVVFGMPKEAIRRGAAGRVMSLDAIAAVLSNSQISD